MLHSTKQELTLSVPLTLAAHHRAQLFYERHPDPHKAKQVYLNTLAVEAVQTYLGWLGIANDPQASDSWDPVIQTLADVADLVLPDQGKLECRPVLPGVETCYIPPETNADRLGYLPVLFDESLETATLLGFIPSNKVSAETEEILLSQVQPIASLLDTLKPQVKSADKSAHLGQWLTGQLTDGWQTVEELFGPQPVFSFRSPEVADQNGILNSVVRGKLLELKPSTNGHWKELVSKDLVVGDRQVVDTLALSDLADCQVALVVGITPTDSLQSDVWMKLCPVGGDRYLPEALEIRVLDDQDTVAMEAQSRKTDMLQLNFKGMLNERFTVEIILNGASLVEKFVI